MFIRYEQPDERGKTRREKNEDATASGVPDVVTPDFIIPEHGEYLWLWYHDLNDMLQRVDDGICLPIPPSEFAAWLALPGSPIVLGDEIAVLRAMDVAFCSEMNKELKALHDKRTAQQAADMEAAKGRK